MPITSHPVFLFIFISFAAILSFQGCVPNAKVPQFHMTTFSLSKFKPFKQSKDDKQKLVYVINYPFFVFNKQSPTDIQSAVSPHSLDIKQEGNKLSYFINKVKGRASMVLSIEYNLEKWKKFDVSVILMSNPKIVTGQINFQNHQLRISSSVTGNLPTNFKPVGVKSFTYIFGMDLTRNIPEQPIYQVQLSVVRVDLKQSLIQIRISGSQKCSINKLSIGYIVFEVNNDIQFGLEEVSLSNQLNPSYRALDGSIITQNNFVGIRAIQVIPKKGELDFSIGIKQNAQNILQIQSINKINLQFAVFRVGNKIQNICSHCVNENKVQLSGNSISCVSSCGLLSKVVKVFNKNVEKCILCSQELFLEQSGGSCKCRTGFIKNTNGACQETTSKGLRVYESTFSKANSECLQANTYRSPGGTCECKIGYQKQTIYNKNSCEPICKQNSYFDNGGCVSCKSGTYPNNQLKNCTQCGDYCSNCLSEYTCETCNIGFQLNSLKVCTEICGDNQIFTDECDDGNKVNGDGCSSQCKAEPNFICSKNLVNGRNESNCTWKKYQISLTSAAWNSATLAIQVDVTPPPQRMTTDEIIQRFTIKAKQSFNPMQVYMSQDQVYLNKIRIVCIYFNVPNHPLNPIIYINFPEQEPKTLIIDNSQIKKKQLNFRSIGTPRK